MQFQAKTFLDRNGRPFVLRNAELEVVATNQRAIALYEKLGFQKYGFFPDNMKYQDESYADAYWMMKKL